MSRRRTIAAAGGLVLLIGGATFVPFMTSADVGATDEPDTTDSVATSSETDLATVERRDLSQRSEANGTLGFGSPVRLPIEGEGIVTEAPESGATVEPGEVLLRIANRPVFLARGTQPLYRELRRVASSERDAAGDRLGLQTGPDVEQLQRFLLAAGFDDEGRLEADGEFGVTTERAVKAWQRSVGLVATGKVDRSQLVFADGAVRIEAAAKVGQPFTEVTATFGSPRVMVTVTARQRDFFTVGNEVTIASASASVSGSVIELERDVGDDGSTRYEVEIEVDDGQALGGAEAVRVTAVRVTASDVLTVPVRALVALAEGGWAVHVSTPTGPKLTAVELGDVIDGTASITGVDEGIQVVVPV